MSKESYESLLKELPRIAKAVNEFGSEATQVAALERLLNEFESPQGKPAGSPSKKPRKKAKTQASAKSGSKSKPAAKRKGSTPKMLADLDLRPDGKISLREFLDDKKPGNQTQQIAVIVYYLKQFLEIDQVNVDHIYTCYRSESKLKVPGNVHQSVRNTASRGGWLTGDFIHDIEVTAAGINFVEHDLPKQAE